MMALWFPSDSLEEKHKNLKNVNSTECTPDNRKQKKRKVTVKIERRKEATVNTQLVASIASDLYATSLSDSSASKGYSTIESTSLNGLEKYDNWKENQQEEFTICGWKNTENIAKLVVMNQPFFNNSGNSMQVKATVSDRLYSSRFNNRFSKKREQYQFTHAETPEEHMRLYRENCSFSYLSLYSRRPNTVAAVTITGGEFEKEQKLSAIKNETSNDRHHMQRNELASSNTRNTYFPKPVTALETTRGTTQSLAPDTRMPSIPLTTMGKFSHTEKDRVLHSLANRLGVNASIDEPKLLSPIIRRTPPSITKKNKTNGLKEDLVLKQSSERNETSNSNSESRPVTKQSKRRQTAHVLPNLKNQRKKSTSSISLSKYFHVNASNKQDHDIDLTAVEDEDEDSVVPNHRSNSNSPPVSPQGEPTQDTLQHSDKWPSFTPSVDPLESFVQKEEAIKRKANSLGLISHKWAKGFIERGFIDGQLPRKIYYEYSRQSTRETKRANSVQKNGSKLSTKQNEKLKELKELYAVSNSKKGGTQNRKDKDGERDRTNRDNCKHSRPGTRLKSNHNISRPATHCKRSKTEHFSQKELENAVKKLQEFKLRGVTQALIQ